MSALSDQVIVVTGGGRGVGRAICLALGAEDAIVVPVARTLTEIEGTQVLIESDGGRAMAVRADVTDPSAVSAMAARVLQVYGRVDALINDAGTFYALGPVAEVDPGQWWTDVTTNMLGTFLPCHCLLPAMIKARHGKIITLLGGGAGNCLPNGSGYASSKTAIVRFTECLAAEVKAAGISVVCMSPGFVRTRLTEYHVYSEAGRKYLPMMRDSFDGDAQYPPDEAAAVAVALCRLDTMPLTGRWMGVGDDIEDLLRRADEIVAGDKRALRLT